MRRIMTTLSMGAAAILLYPPLPVAAAAHSREPETLAVGKEIAFNSKKGNCLACHAIADGVSPGTIGPPLINMKTRFPSLAALRDQIWDPTKRNPDSPMPPFGKHRILSADEIDKVAAFIWSQ